MQKNLGERIAEGRLKLGWTQQDLAERLAISRVAVSNLESGRSVPGERTVVLLAGVFGIEPHELVTETSYPPGKAERLPLVAARHTEVDLQIRLFENDYRWLEGADRHLALRVLDSWGQRFSALISQTHDPRELAKLGEARRRLRSFVDDLHGDDG